jgi:nitrite reductase (NO-forming)
MLTIALLLLGCGEDKTVPSKQQTTVEKNISVAKEKPTVKKTTKPKAKPKPKSTDSNAGRTGQQVYEQVCVTCHLNQGQGIPGIYPPLAKSDWLTKDNSVLIKVVLHGLVGDIVVNDKPYNNVMTAWGGMLNDEEVANVLTYIRSSWGNEQPAITSKEVEDIRKKYDGHSPWNNEELSK